MSLPLSLLFRRALLADAALSGAVGLVMFAGPDLFAGLLALPVALALLVAGFAAVPAVGLRGSSRRLASA